MWSPALLGDSPSARGSLSLLGGFQQAWLRWTLSESVRKRSSKPRKSTVQSDAVGASWGLEGSSSAWKEMGKKALGKTGMEQLSEQNHSPSCTLQVKPWEPALLPGPQTSLLCVSPLPTHSSQRGLGLLQRAPERDSRRHV